MKKGIKEKITDFFNELANISLVGWMSGLGFFLGLPFAYLIFDFVWKEQNELNLFCKILLTLFLVVISVLYTAGAIALSGKEKEEKERYLSTEDYHTYKKFKGWSVGSYAEFITKASNEYVGSIFEDNMNYGISCAIIDFMEDNNNINSLYSIRLFSYYIRQHWEKYENREVVVDCFLLPYNGLSMTPFAKDRKFECNYDKEFLDYLRKKKSTLYTMNEVALESIVYKFKSDYSNYSNSEFNIGFRCPEGFDYWKYESEKDLPIFVKVRGNLTIDKYSNSFVIGNCRFEDQYYETYMMTLREKSQEWRR